MGLAMKLGFFNVLFFILLFCKLAGYITISWWWVTAPLWCIPVTLLVLFVIVSVTAVESFNKSSK